MLAVTLFYARSVRVCLARYPTELTEFYDINNRPGQFFLTCGVTPHTPRCPSRDKCSAHRRVAQLHTESFTVVYDILVVTKTH